MQAQLQRYRDDCGIWALDNAPQCAKLAMMPELLGLPECLDDRAADYMGPLFAISHVADTEKRRLVEFCESLANMRQSDAKDSNPARIVNALREWFPADQTSARIHNGAAAELFQRLEYPVMKRGPVSTYAS